MATIPRYRSKQPLLALLVSLAAAVGCNAQVEVTFDTAIPLRTLDRTYLSFNIDTASLYNGLDLTDGVLHNLVAQLAPSVLRIGGTAADSAVYTGNSSRRGGDGKGHTLINNVLWDEIVAFAKSTRMTLLWDLNGEMFRRPDGSWDETGNATAFLKYTLSRGYTSGIDWSIGNEPEVWTPPVNGSQSGYDAATLTTLLQQLGLPGVVSGASFAWYDPAAIQLFFQSSRGFVDALTVHQYPLNHGTECTLAGALNRTNTERLIATFDGTVALRKAFGSSQTKLVLEETAGSSGGGCINITDRFAGGFVHLHTLGLGAEHGFDRIHRQDLVGWSFVTRASNYQLLGAPGWINSSISGPLTPHPDYFLSVLFRQNIGDAVLNSTVVDAGHDFTAHVYCASTRMSAGGVALIYLNYGASDVSIELPGLGAGPTTEWMLTSSAEAYEAFAARRAAGTPLQDGGNASSTAPPDSLHSDVAFLNGKPMTVGADGVLPAFPIKGRAGQVGLLSVPPFSFGFVQIDGPFGACSG